MVGYNGKVQRHSFGIQDVSDYSKISSGAASIEYLQKRAVTESYNALDRKVDQAEKHLKEQEIVSKIHTRKLLESQIPMLVNEVSKMGKTVVLKDILFEMFSKALVLDEDFVVAQEENLRALIESYVDGKGGYALLENAYRQTKSPFLKSLKTICESAAGKVSRRKLTEAQEGKLDVSAISFELNDDEKHELDYDKEKINIEELSDLVKKKVLTVVQDEKARQAKEQEIYDDLAAQAQGEEQSVEESIKRSLIKETPVEESTLFNSLFRHSYKEALESALAASASQDLDDDFETEDYNVNARASDINGEAKENTTPSQEARAHGSVQTDIDMDLILAESITKYTLMELSYTIQLEAYDYDSIRKISQKLLN